MHILITHNDLDGVGCAVLFSAVMERTGKEYRCYFEDYRTVNERIIQVLASKPHKILLTDISPDEKVAELLDKSGIPIHLFDHHRTALWLNSYPWANVDTSYCATRLLYDHIKRTWDGVTMYKHFVYLVNDWDMWLHEYETSKMLNTFLTAIGKERFVKRFLNDPWPIFNSNEEMIIEVELERKEEYVQKAVEKAKIYNNNYAVTIAEKYKSEIGEKLLQLAPIAVIIDPREDTVSLRSKDDKHDVSEIAKKFGGGGHPRAAGFELPKGSVLDTLANMVNLVKEGE